MKQGFTLLELSIVLVIIGLIVGGIVMGQHLIRAGELNAVTNQVHQYLTAVETFRLKYNAMPGDLNKASSFWSGATNGNNNKKTDYVADATGGETLIFWQHLDRSGILPTGLTGALSGGELAPGINVPFASINKDSGYQFYDVNYASWAKVYSKLNGHGLHLGACANFVSSSEALCGAPLFHVQDAVAIDTKMDDGLADSGKVYGVNAATYLPGFAAVTGCAGNWSVATASYDHDSNKVACHMYFWYD